MYEEFGDNGLEKVLTHIASELNYRFPEFHIYISKSGSLPQLVIRLK